MKGQTNKRRKVIINGEMIYIQSKRITICESPLIMAGKVKVNDRWYIFDLDTGKVLFQGNNWNDCLNGTKELIKTYLLD
jgi:hypothetical protein